MNNWPTAQLGDQLRRGERVASVLRSVGIPASVRQECKGRYHVALSLDSSADRVLSAYSCLAIMEMCLSGITVSEVHQERADWTPEKRVIGVDFYIEGEPVVSVPWLKSPPEDAPKRIEVNVCETEPQPVAVTILENGALSSAPPPAPCSWWSAFWFVRGWPVLAPVTPHLQ